MPLLDAFGRPIAIVPKRTYTRRPKTKPAKRRVSQKSIAAGTKVLRDIAPNEITLAARHTINGVPYGPGRVTVPKKIAEVLLEGERRAAWSDANFAGTRACVIGPGRVKGALGVREVAPEFFDTQYASAVPFGVVDRGTATFQPY